MDIQGESNILGKILRSDITHQDKFKIETNGPRRLTMKIVVIKV